MPAGRRRSAPKASAARPRGWTVRSRRPIGKGSLGIVMRFHDVCGRLVAHPLHENRLPGDTLFKNPHQPSKIGRTRNSSDIEAVIYAYATEVEPGAKDEERISAHCGGRKAMVHPIVHPNRKLLTVPCPLETGS